MVHKTEPESLDEESGQGGTDRSGYYIAAIGRALAVLDTFSPQRPELTLRDMAEAAKVSQPSALRIGYTLVQAGYLVKNPLTKGYRLGPKAISVGMATLNSLTLPELAEPYLIDLRNRTQETVKLAIHHGPTVVFVSRVPSLLHPPGAHYVGSSLPIHASGLGRAILAHLPEETALQLIEKSAEARLTAKTPTKAQARRELAQIRKRGYAINDQSTTVENRAVAAPLLDATGVPAGAINLSMSAQRITMADMEKRMAPLVMETAQAISAVLPPHVQGAGWS
ncbi:IclR family transcriptional regulator [Streptomyces sp. NPDC047081]|uniref:IclR family transcriptional regulator n=1 Tax=Streptomyces sp. NPDC047081 TaxID=3154706 RepID=UPI003409F693